MRALLAFTTLAVLAELVSCAPPPAQTGSPLPQAALPPGRVSRDSTSATLVPAGYGTLKQDDISIVLQQEGVRVTLTPLDESVIRTLAPDSYRALRANLESKRQQIAQRASLHAVREPRVWYARFNGLAPDARFLPTDITITSGGREYRPFDVVPITPGFGTGRLDTRDQQAGLLLFEEGVDVSQPLVLTMGAEHNVDWQTILSRLEGERASIRARASRSP